MKKSFLALLVLAIVSLAGCFQDKSNTEVNVSIQKDSVDLKDADSIAKSYNLQLSDALELTRGLKREGLNVSDLHDDLEIQANENLKLGFIGENEELKTIDDVIGSVELDEELEGMSQKEIEEYEKLKKELIEDSITKDFKTGILSGTIEQEGVTGVIEKVIDNKVYNEVKKNADYLESLEKVKNGEITMDDLNLQLSESFDELKENKEFQETSQRFLKRSFQIKQTKRVRAKAIPKVGKFNNWNDTNSYYLYLNELRKVKAGDLFFVATDWDVPTGELAQIAEIFPNFSFGKAGMDHCGLVVKDLNVVVDLIFQYENYIEFLLKYEKHKNASEIANTAEKYLKNNLFAKEIKLKMHDGSLDNRQKTLDYFFNTAEYRIINEVNLQKSLMSGIGNVEDYKGVSYEQASPTIKYRLFRIHERKWYSSTKYVNSYIKEQIYLQECDWHTVVFSKVKKKYTKYEWCWIGWSYKRFKIFWKWVTIQIPTFGFKFYPAEKYPSDHTRQQVVNRMKNLKGNDWILYGLNCGDRLFEVWGKQDSGIWTPYDALHINSLGNFNTGKGYIIDHSLMKRTIMFSYPDNIYLNDRVEVVVGHNFE